MKASTDSDLLIVRYCGFVEAEAADGKWESRQIDTNEPKGKLTVDLKNLSSKEMVKGSRHNQPSLRANGLEQQLGAAVQRILESLTLRACILPSTGWAPGLARVRKGCIRYIVVPPSLGFADDHAGKVPPKSTLVFKVRY
jgi:hypothetical protein